MTEGARAQTLLAKALGLSEAEVSDNLTIMDCPSWDSLAHMRVVLAVETELGRPLAPDEIFSIAGTADIAKLLASAG
jgi:acyl carrier protein